MAQGPMHSKTAQEGPDSKHVNVKPHPAKSSKTPTGTTRPKGATKT